MIAIETHTHTHTGDLQSFSLTVPYAHGSADLQVHITGPRSHDIDQREIIRLEIHAVLDALEKAVEASDNILLSGATGRL